jgi:hypothetical protein
VEVNGHLQTHAVKSSKFRAWLLRQFYKATRSVPSDNALKGAIALLEARALFDGTEREVYLRVAEDSGRYYLDLCDGRWRAVEISTQGWNILDRPPVRFYRRQGMMPLPEPTRGGSIETLRGYLNLRTGQPSEEGGNAQPSKNDNEFVLVVAWILAALRPVGPYPVGEVNGQEGTAKTSMLRVLRRLVDPAKPTERGPPREERDLVIAASKGHVIAYDNLSHLPIWLSDALCRIATGGGFGTRALYTDDEEKLFSDTRPILLGAVNDVIVSGDLASRTVRFALEVMAKTRATEEYWAAFERDCPSILGVLLDAVAHGLRELPQAKERLAKEELPRMADFAVWATACETAFWDKGTFLRVYRDNIVAVTREVVESDLIGNNILRLLEKENRWKGTAGELLSRLGGIAGEQETKNKYWPQSAKSLGKRLRMVATSLKRLGIEIRFWKSGERHITIEKSKVRKETPETPERPERQKDNENSAGVSPGVSPEGTEANARPNARANPLEDDGSGRSGVSGVFSRTKPTASQFKYRQRPS